MPTEVTVLGLAALLQGVQFVLMAVPANMELGTDKTLSPRDQPLDLTGKTARLKRAMDNHFEALILFTIAVVIVTLGDASSPLTRGCAYAYLAARVVYVPAYAFGWQPWRSLIWMVGFAATFTMIAAALV